VFHFVKLSDMKERSESLLTVTGTDSIEHTTMSAEKIAVPAQDTIISAQEPAQVTTGRDEDGDEDCIEGSGEEIHGEPTGPGRCTVCRRCARFAGGRCQRTGCGHRYRGEHMPVAPGR
jgi:hypothetical protein